MIPDTAAIARSFKGLFSVSSLLGGEKLHDCGAEHLGASLLRHQLHHVLDLLGGEEAAQVEVQLRPRLGRRTGETRNGTRPDWTEVPVRRRRRRVQLGR